MKPFMVRTQLFPSGAYASVAIYLSDLTTLKHTTSPFIFMGVVLIELTPFCAGCRTSQTFNQEINAKQREE